MTKPKIRWDQVSRFTRTPTYETSVPWYYIEKKLESWKSYGNLDLDPDFQRAHVWSTEKQIRYVEYMVRGGKGSRTIYWNQPGWPSVDPRDSLQLVDGKQRLEAVRRFLRNELTIFSNFTLSDFEGIPSHCEFIFAVNDLPTRVQVLQWYLDLNSGGVVHTDEELERVRLLLEREKEEPTK